MRIIENISSSGFNASGSASGLAVVTLAMALVLWTATVLSPASAIATPLIAMQSSERCDTCHLEPDASDPKWVEANTPLKDRKCRLTCGACHVNPSGGMLRNEFGYYYGTRTLPRTALVNGPVAEFMSEYRVNKYFSLGGDFRFMSLYDEEREENPVFFPMQADLYVNARLHEHVGFLGQWGMERGGNPSVREATGIVDNLPYNGYLKMGRMLPPFGHRLDDHTAYVRSMTGLDHSKRGSYVSGIEAGAEPLVFFGRGAYFVEDLTPAASDESALRGGSMVAGWHGLWLNLGMSYMDMMNYSTTSALTVDRSAWGVFGAVRPHKVPYLERLTLLFEYDVVSDDLIDPAGDTESQESEVLFTELDYRACKGVNLKLRYETYDPDDDSGEVELERIVAGLEYFPYPFVEFDLQYRHEEDEGGADNDQVMWIGHLWF